MALHYMNKLMGDKELLKKMVASSAIFFFIAWGSGFVMPILNIYFNQIADDFFLTGILISLMGIAAIVFSIPAGILCDKFNTKRIIQFSILICAIIPLLFTLTTKISHIFAIRSLEAIFATLMWTGIWTHVYREVDSKSTASEVSVLSRSIDTATTISPILGGLLATLAFFFPFYAWSFSTFVAFFVVTIYMKPMPPAKIDSFSYLIKKDIEILKHFFSKYRFSIFITIFTYSIATMIGSFLPIMLNIAGLSYFHIGIVVSITFFPVVFLEVPIGKYIDKVGRGRALLLGLLTLCLCAIALAISLNFYLTLIVMVFFGISHVTTFISATSIYSDLSKEDSKGLMSGVRRVVLGIGIALGPLLGGFFFKFFGYSATMLFFAFTGFSVATFYLFWKGENI